ncbi:MAG: mechanosensitive ion channel protein MscS [Methylotenera sp.]|uniref:mechanosensitive ion channel protein MscS n=1 Tax=Methylotenera sp. TaxID=2051956 RepID=UPI002487BB25|nr:mechanosensitive ion channel protein MscS [Methylotenera sp.]MDI1309545.1 mechanosensitive ion channel protein MscS [Methylotenera sp.]
MPNDSSRLTLIAAVVAMIILPLIASWFAYPVIHLPPGFGVFPPLFVQDPPGFNLIVFIGVALIEAAFVTFLVFPQWFGFKPVAPPPKPTLKALPIWFWLGLGVTLFFWWLMWTRTTVFGSLVYYAFTPLWWGFIFVLDGLTYRYSGGYSLFASKPKTFLISAIVSVGGWFFFEYFDYFALGNWYYPNTVIPGLSHANIVGLFFIAYSTVWPAVFEWYTLLNAFPQIANRYSQGPKLSLPGKPMLYLSFILFAAVPFWPYPLFWAMWIAPLIGIAGILMMQNVWTPFTAISNGNWSPTLLIALSSLFNGFFWEIWNFGSAHPVLPVSNPNYWVYDIPYVNVIHIHAEMPLLGFFGYLPFGVLVWVVFIWAGKVFNFNSSLLADGKGH